MSLTQFQDIHPPEENKIFVGIIRKTTKRIGAKIVHKVHTPFPCSPDFFDGMARIFKIKPRISKGTNDMNI
jgi:hypothetical protein